MRILVAVLSIVIGLTASGKVTLKGVVKDDKGEVIPYATITVPSRSTGTLTDSVGAFGFVLNNVTDNDSVSFSSIGYDDFTATVGRLRSMGDKLDIVLHEHPYELDEVVVIPPKVKKKTFGRTSMNGKFEIQIGSEHPEGCGVGVRCKVGKRAWITSVSMGWIQRDNCVERMPFRLNAYKKRNGVWTNVTRQPVMFTYTKEALGGDGRFVYRLPEPMMINGDTMVEFEFLEPMHGHTIYIKSNVLTGHFNWHEYGKWESMPVGGSFAVHVLVEK
ncbi:carboxypeptidase-like regulatory domain-containing protein [uncultured Muribaculum sp.]|uniref:carboxypeptidase-like regulatory domain-containing protein n=2 Tax=uncultured Muribaculum sp. TaxID=1918613 RepID=UPI00259C7F93|nr:carboxypeptidase-like regulatory domain-containing protein [uncultured Muribaculum sp.]